MPRGLVEPGQVGSPCLGLAPLYLQVTFAGLQAILALVPNISSLNWPFAVDKFNHGQFLSRSDFHFDRFVLFSIDIEIAIFISIFRFLSLNFSLISDESNDL